MKDKIKFILKLLFGLGVLIFLFSKTSFKEFINLLANANYKMFVLIIFMYIIGQIISAKKWMILAERLRFKNSFIYYLKLYFLGMFYNIFLPTNIGGDIVKISTINDKKTHSIKRAVLSVLSDRITGLCILIFFITLGFYLHHNNTILNIISIGIIFSSLIGIFLFIYIMKNKRFIPLKYKKISDLILLLCQKKCLVEISVISIIFHFILIVMHYCIAQMYNLNIPFGYYFLLYPIIAIISSLPISINGMGIKEFAYVYMLKPFDIDTSTSLLFAMTFNMAVIFASTLGFIPYMSKNQNN
mgnify:CR=1 FL=1